MSNLVGYVGARSPVDVLLQGLRRLEHLGYDSAGLAVDAGDGIQARKLAGRVDKLEELLRSQPIVGGQAGIAHLRWATHGKPADYNSHPHLDCSGRVAVVHNGIIENHAALRAELSARGHRFTSDTDTEVISHLIEEAYDGDLAAAVRRILPRLKGIYAIAVCSSHEPGRLVAAGKEKSLIVGLGQGENFVASDFAAIIPFTRRSYVLEAGEIADIRRDGVIVTDLEGRPVTKQLFPIEWDVEQAEKGGFAHFMLKEIHEQPRVMLGALSGRIADSGDTVVLPDVSLSPQWLQNLQRVYFVGCGTAYHAGVVSAYMTERLAKVDARAEIASEFRYREPKIDQHTLVISVSQSGETADTLAALREAKARGAGIIAIVNVVGSTMAREAQNVLYSCAGPEISVASTKGYTTQLLAGALLAIYLGQARGKLDSEAARQLIAAIRQLPQQVAQVLDQEPAIQELAARLAQCDNAFYIGRGLDYAVALEGQLKLKETSYIHAEACPAGELKHGPLALIEPGMPVIAVNTQPDLREKTLSNIQEIRSRGAWVLAVVPEDDDETAEQADAAIRVPVTHPYLMPVTTIVPLQLLAYYTAVARGNDVDRPRNLVKSVTVE